MSSSLADAVLAWANRNDSESARIIGHVSGRRVLQWRDGVTTHQIEMSGRPDGVQVGTFPTMLAALRDRAARPDDSRITPQEWMELDREYAGFEYRRRGLLIAAALGQKENDSTTATELYDLAAHDAAHQLGIVAFVAQSHPAGQMPGANPGSRPTLLSQQIVALAMVDFIHGRVEAAVQRTREGVRRVTETLEISGTPDPANSSIVRQMEAFAEALSHGGDMIAALSRQLEQAIAAERYELAASLRDRIAVLRGSAAPKMVTAGV
jgi:hypothetical protein